MDVPRDIVDKTPRIVRSSYNTLIGSNPNYSAITLIQVQKKGIVYGDHGTGDTFISGEMMIRTRASTN